MFRTSIKKQNTITHQAQFQTEAEAQSWLAQEEANKSFGLPERWAQDTLLSPLSEEQKAMALETRTVEVMGEQVTEYRLPSEYEVIIEDITQQVQQEKINAEALAYLASTDWYVIRQTEAGVLCPEEIKVARQAARDSIVK